MNGMAIAFLQPATDLHRLSDDDFLKAIAWKRSAAVHLAEAATQGNRDAFCRSWSKFLAGRNRQKEAAGRRHDMPALWSRYAFERNDRTDELLGALEVLVAAKPRRSRKRIGKRRSDSSAATNGDASRRSKGKIQHAGQLLASWIDAALRDATVSPGELLLLLDILSNPHVELHRDALWPIWRIAFTAAIELSNNLEPPAGCILPEDQRLLIAGELPWRLGLLFSDVKGAGKLARSGRQALRKALLQKTDEDGTPHAELLERLPLWLAPLVRSALAGDHFGERLWTGRTRNRFVSLVETIAPLCRPDGRIALSNGSSHKLVSLLQASLQAAGVSKSSPSRSLIRSVEAFASRRKSPRMLTVTTSDDAPAGQSDWARLAVLRTDWSIDANSLVVAHHGELPLIDLCARGKQLLSGPWEIAVLLDGKPLKFKDEWECVCWFSDSDADYLELQVKFEDGIRIDRQILLSRDNDFALLADSVCGAGARKIEYTSRLPFAAGIDFESRAETRECLLTNGKKLARAFPLALPEDRIQSTPGGFGRYDGHIVLRQVSAGQGLYAPVILDWAPQRKGAAADWRTLTVSEAGHAVAAGTAAGHRLRMGDHQLFVYHSLQQSDELRTCLGHHTKYETIVGEFDETGTVAPIVMVE